MSARRCLLLFARGAREEARVKRIASPQLFDVARRRIERIARVAGVDLVVSRAQRGATFGERLENAFREAAATYDEVAVVPIDVPQLTVRDVVRAFALLRTHDLVLGPSDDGGVYLIAGRAGAANRFASVRWLTPHVFTDLRCESTAILDPLVDVDGRDDVKRVAAFVPRAVIDGLAFSQPAAAHRDKVFVAATRGRAPPPLV